MEVPPGKKWFRIGEVSALTGVQPHVLRYWERELPSLRPRKSRSGHRIYSRSDLELVVLVRRLLREEGFTLSGVRKLLAEGEGAKELKSLLEERAGEAERLADLEDLLKRIRREVLEALRELEEAG